MPKVDNLDELFEVVLSQIQEGEIRLQLPEEAPPTFKAISGQGPDEEETGDVDAAEETDETEASEEKGDSEAAENNATEDEEQ